jgi:hypothetical protein
MYVHTCSGRSTCVCRQIVELGLSDVVIRVVICNDVYFNSRVKLGDTVHIFDPRKEMRAYPCVKMPCKFM